MDKTIVPIPNETYQRLEKKAKELGKSADELAREIISEALAECRRE